MSKYGRKIFRTFRPTQGRPGKSDRPRPVRGRPGFSGYAAWRDRAQQHRARPHPRHPLWRRHSVERIHDRYRRRHPRQERNCLDRARPALPRRRSDQPSRGADRPPGASGPLFTRRGAPRGAHRRGTAARNFFDRGFPRETRHPLWRRQYFQGISPGKGRRGRRMGAGGHHRRGRIPDRRAGAALHRKSGHDRDGQSFGRCNRLGFAAMSVLCAQSAGHLVWSPRRKKFE